MRVWGGGPPSSSSSLSTLSGMAFWKAQRRQPLPEGPALLKAMSTRWRCTTTHAAWPWLPAALLHWILWPALKLNKSCSTSRSACTPCFKDLSMEHQCALASKSSVSCRPYTQLISAEECRAHFCTVCCLTVWQAGRQADSSSNVEPHFGCQPCTVQEL